MSRIAPFTALCLSAGLALALAPAASGQVGRNEVAGTITITGTAGPDTLLVELSGTTLRLVPAVTFTATIGSCPPATDLLTGRPVSITCIVRTDQGPVSLVVDLGAGNDAIEASLSSAVRTVTVAGGAGNDTLIVSAPNSSTLRGGDGDDTLTPDSLGHLPFALDGGAGRDLVDYAAGMGEPDIGVTASLAAGTATLRLPRPTHPAGDLVRTDTLTAIERISGTQWGDVLTGGTGNDELNGVEGPDNLNGAGGADTVTGGGGDDRVDGGAGADGLDGGPGFDTFLRADGGDTVNSRDGFPERVTCLAGDVFVNDLVDTPGDPIKCTRIETAAAKHVFDTFVSGRRLVVGDGGALPVRMKCPARKPEDCVGTLAVRLGGSRGARLARGRYSLEPGEARTLRLRLSPAEARRVRGRTLTLEGNEVDADGRDRRVLRRVPVAR